MISGKFAISIHILTLLAKFPDEYLSSEFIASSINLNPVLVRKEIANLKKNQIVMSKEGKNGGTKLNISPSKVTLKQIFESTFEEISLGFSKNEPNPKCPVGKEINQNLSALYTTLNDSVMKQLEATTLEEFANKF
ncbi:BadM/Rrf2 family transcriptional regulator [Flavobacterium aquaticum]|uniref:BadM/Rrf2 family transcriptional regulator n=1 Tax=Flavobacterium aquaticum TaxID=1236486 RepID=A0A327YUZ6_9FLAO|nr:Rrf2 family transcriptional regulator [Flavobacterium aquaticum]RAK24860.1 BadM/Rrf2 family transcriptional regulator [Flavobacterium aquaticum]